MDYHEAANIFPLLEGEEFEALKGDIQTNGQREPIWTLSGKILDGRNRFRACSALGIPPIFQEYEGDDPVSFVVSLNLHRRHLTESQRAYCAAKVANLSGPGQPKKNTANLQNTSRAQAAKLLNVSERSVNTAKKVERSGSEELKHAVESGGVSISAAADVAELPQDEQREIVARGKKEILAAANAIRKERADKKKAERLAKLAEIIEPAPSLNVDRRYPLIYCDPPWRYDYSETETRAIENQYPTMTLEDICALPVSEMAMDDCVLLMWTTSPKLRDSMDVIDAWGFTYRTCAIWDKKVIGMGYYFRQQHEILLVASRGSVPVPDPSARPPSIFSERRSKHSSKPDVAYSLIEQMYPDLPKIELFARKARDGWDRWGNQAQ